MNLITLNLWGGQVYEPLLVFLKERSKDTDIFCFQEIIYGSEPAFTSVHKARLNLFSEISACLTDFEAFKYPDPDEVEYFQSEVLPSKAHAGQAILVKKSLPVTNNGGFRTYQTLPKDTIYGGKITGSCQWVEVEGSLTVLNLHGIWQKETNKVDTPERFTQSKIIMDFLAAKSGKKIICGDFNLRPDGESMQILEKNMRNLIKEFGITSTRSELYTKPEKFADYALVSPEVNVEEFKVLPDIVSDHLPLELRF